MARDYVINGETLVRVKFGSHVNPLLGLATSTQPTILELGLASEGIRITPDWRHYDLHADDFGPQVPPEVLWMGGTCDVQMTLVHFDMGILQFCLSEAEGGLNTDVLGNFNEGNLVPFGRPLGAGLPLYASGNHHVALELSSPVRNNPWSFAACHLTRPPMILPLSTERSLAMCHWRAIPYAANTQSGTILVPPGQVLSGTVFQADHFYSIGDMFTISGATFTVTPAMGVLNSGQLVTLSGFVPATPMGVTSSGILLWDHLADVAP